MFEMLDGHLDDFGFLNPTSTLREKKSLYEFSRSRLCDEIYKLDWVLSRGRLSGCL